jgi:hypothetical protein
MPTRNYLMLQNLNVHHIKESQMLTVLVFMKLQSQGGYLDTRVSFTGEFSQNFDLKSMILTSTKDFSWKK